MIIRTKKKANPYAQIDKRILNDERLSWGARGLLSYLLSKPSDWKVRLRDLVNKSRNDGNHKVKTFMRELRELGYAELIKIQDDRGRLSGSDYVIHEQPKNEQYRECENHTVGFTESMKNRRSEKPTIEKTDGRKITPLTNNDSTNNDIVTNNERTNARACEKIPKEVENEKDIPPKPQPEPTPQVAAPPPSFVEEIEPKEIKEEITLDSLTDEIVKKITCDREVCHRWDIEFKITEKGLNLKALAREYATWSLNKEYAEGLSEEDLLRRIKRNTRIKYQAGFKMSWLNNLSNPNFKRNGSTNNNHKKGHSSSLRERKAKYASELEAYLTRRRMQKSHAGAYNHPD